jgi:hypothetical protein
LGLFEQTHNFINFFEFFRDFVNDPQIEVNKLIGVDDQFIESLDRVLEFDIRFDVFLLLDSRGIVLEDIKIDNQFNKIWINHFIINEKESMSKFIELTIEDNKKLDVKVF